MNKIFATVLAAVMTVSLTSVAFADTTKDMGFVLGYKTDATGNGATVYADQDDDGKYDDDTLAGLKNLEAGSKIYIPILKWDDKNSNSTVENGELTQPTSSDIKGYKAYANWKVGSLDENPEIKYVKFKGVDGNYGYGYAVVVTLPETESSKVFDLAGTLSVAKTSSKANDAIKQNKFAFDTSYASTTTMLDKYDGGDLGKGGAIVKFAEDCGEIDIEFGEEALFTVNASGQGKLNLKYNTDFTAEFAAMYKDANIDFLNFAGEPSFNRNGTLYIYAKEDSYLYEVTADGAKELDAKWDEDYEAWKLTTRTLTSYAVSDTKLDTKTTTEDKEEGSSSTGSSSTDSGKENPDTGR